MNSLGPSMCNLTCGECGHEADFEEFRHTPINGELPGGTYQCPSCKGAWRYEAIGKGTLYPSGLFVPADRKRVVIPTIL